MRPLTSATEPRVTSWVTSSPSLAKKPLSIATQIGRLVAPAKVTMVSLVAAAAGIGAVKASAHATAVHAAIFEERFMARSPGVVGFPLMILRRREPPE